MKYLLATLTVLMSSIAYADHHAPPAEPLVVEIHGCTLNEGVVLADVIKVGRAEFSKLFSADKLKMSSYIWEAVAVSPPFHAPDLRWVNYYPTWADWDASETVWRDPKSAKIVEKIFSLITCDRPMFGSAQMIAPIPAVEEKYLIAGVCKLEPGKSLVDVRKYRTRGRTSAINAAIEANNGGALIYPGFGMTGDFDYVQTLTGEKSSMTKLLDGVRTGTVAAANQTYSEMDNPATCTWDLHRAHAIVQ
jgi:hypothetical protein